MNMSLNFSTEIQDYMGAIFVYDGTLSCLHRFDKFDTIFSITIFFYLRSVFELNMTMLSSIVCQSFGIHLSIG